MPFEARPATDADVPALLALQQRYDIRWFGEPEHDELEVREALERVDPLSGRSRLLFDGDRLVAAAWWWRADCATLPRWLSPRGRTASRCRQSARGATRTPKQQRFTG